MSYTAAKNAALVDGLNESDRAQFDTGARGIQRFLVGGNDLTFAIESYAREVGRRLNHDLPLRAFTQTIYAGPLIVVPGQGEQAITTRSSSARWNDWIYVYGYTATVAGLRFQSQEQSPVAPNTFFLDPRDYVLCSITDSSNQAVTIANISGLPDALINGIPLSEFAGKGGLVNNILATGYSAGSQLVANFATAPNCGIERVAWVSLSCHYVRLPLW
jgi:hypothetical protein